MEHMFYICVQYINIPMFTGYSTMRFVRIVTFLSEKVTEVILVTKAKCSLCRNFKIKSGKQVISQRKDKKKRKEKNDRRQLQNELISKQTQKVFLQSNFFSFSIQQSKLPSYFKPSAQLMVRCQKGFKIVHEFFNLIFLKQY